MGWVRLSDDFYDHEKFAAAGPLGIALWTAGLAWCNRNLTDGRIPRTVALRLVDWEGVGDVLEEASSNGDRNGVTNGASNGPRNSAVAAVVASKLVEVGAWTVTDGGFEVHDYLDYQRSAAQIQAEARGNAARQQRFRDARKTSGRNGVTNARVTGAPNPNPNPNTKQTPSAPEPALPPPPDDPSAFVLIAADAPTPAAPKLSFEDFYSAYPKKIAPEAARRAWNRIVKEGKTSPATIVAGAARYAADPNLPQRTFIPNPATWLNAGSWDDEPCAPRHDTGPSRIREQGYLTDRNADFGMPA